MDKKEIKIKVCGMRDPDNIRELAGLLPDFMGFILYPGSKRYVGRDYKLSVNLPGTIKKTGVFVDEEIPILLDWVNRLQLDYVQLHGQESPQYCHEVRKNGISVIKAFGIDMEFDFSIVDNYSLCCNYFLFDTNTHLHGGSGNRFDWSLLEKYNANLPVFLSGGIGPYDTEVIKQCRFDFLYAIDINSRFEKAPAVKDIAKLAKFIGELRS